MKKVTIETVAKKVGVSAATVSYALSGKKKISPEVKDKIFQVIKELVPDESVYRELALVKVRCAAQERPSVIAITDIFRGKIVDVAADSLIIEITGGIEKIDKFLDLLEGHEILELARTGMAGLSRGIENVTFLP